VKETRSNDRLLQVMTSAGLSYKALARAVREESVRASHPVRCDHTAVSRWCEGTHPRARTTQFIAAVLSAKLDRTVTLSDIGLSETSTADRQGANGLAAVSGLLAAAEECSTDVLARSGELGTGAISHLQERIVLLARSYNDMPSVQAFATARDLRAVTLRLVQTTHRPRHLADLYTVLGQATALMGSTAFDLGRWDAAAILARCSTEYADLAGHASLTAWAYGLRATVAFWSRDVAGALDAVGHGLAVAPAGSPEMRLHYIAARTHAVGGNVEEVAESLRTAETLAATVGGHDELHDEIRGEFRFDEGRAAACAGAAWLTVGDGTRAEAYISRPLNESGLTGAGLAAGARLDLTSALLLKGDLDAAGAVLEAVLAPGASPTSVAVSSRLARARDQLATTRWRNEPAARRLHEEANVWLARAVPLPALSSSA
jgi:hypothetical protein